MNVTVMLKKTWFFINIFVMRLMFLKCVYNVHYALHNQLNYYPQRSQLMQSIPDSTIIQQTVDLNKHPIEKLKTRIHSQKYNSHPVIGVLTQPSSWPSLYDPEQYSYIASSYVKWIESAGGQVIPIFFDDPKEKIIEVFQGINGLFFPGGGNELYQSHMGRLTTLGETGKLLLQMAIRANDEEQDYFPVWGTCLGLEILISAIQPHFSLEEVTDSNQSHEVYFLEDSKDSRLFGKMNKMYKHWLENEKLMYFNHKFAITPQIFQKSKKLKQFFKPLTVNQDESGIMFISSIEAIKYPFFGVQFHPEKNSYEFKDQFNIKHSLHGIKVSQFFIDFFVDEARKNDRAYEDPFFLKHELIINYSPVQISDTFMSVYIFKSESDDSIDH